MVSLSLKTFVILAQVLALVNGLVVPVASDDSSSPSRASIIKRGGVKALKLGFDIRRGSDQATLSDATDNHVGVVVNHNKRGDVEMSLKNAKTFYTTDIGLGSNKQPITVLVDTGSSDLWVVAKGASCQANARGVVSDCTSHGIFDSKSSTSYKNLGEAFSIQYLDKTSSQGTWATESISFGDAKVTGLRFGDVTSTSNGYGILGIAKPGAESARVQYDNLPILLKSQGIVDKNAYSLYLDSQDATTGSVLFGAIDKAKFSGKLISLPMSSDAELSVNLQSATFGGQTVNIQTSVLLDSGTTLSYLPSALVQLLAKKMGATYNNGSYQVPCNGQTNQTLDYNFNGVTIKVPYSDLIMRAYYTNGQPSNTCYLSIQETQGGRNILGDNFLRSAYVYYDLDDSFIALAQANYTDKEDIQVV